MKFLVVGLGSAGSRHTKNLIALGVSEVEVCSEWRRLSHFSSSGRRFRVFQNYQAALDARPEAVIVANPTSFHAAYVAQALKRGCHVYVEKPLAVSAEEALPLLDFAREGKTTVAVGAQLRFNPCLEQLKKLLAAGSLGQLLHVRVCMGEYLPDYHPEEDYRRGYAARRDLGGGILLTQIHDINYLHWLFGSFDSVYAIGGKTSRLEIDVEDNVSFLLKTPGGLALSVHQDFLQRPRVRTCAVVGDEGVVYWDYYGNSLRFVARTGAETELGPKVPLNRNQMFLNALKDFIVSAQNGTSPRTTLSDGIADLLVTDAVRNSMVTNTVIRIAHDARLARIV